MSERATEACEKDQAMLDKLHQKFNCRVLKLNATPTFFVNGEMLKRSI
jgi:hypothetical protein